MSGTGRFTSVRADVEESDDGNVLTYSIWKKLILANRVTITGAKRLKSKIIEDELDLNPGDMVDDHTLAASARKVVRLYREKFYPNTRLTWKINIIDEHDGRADVTITVDEGERLKIGRLHFDGNKAMRSSKLLKVFRESVWWNPFSWFRKLRLDSEEWADARERIRVLYVEKGFLDVDIPQSYLETSKLVGV